MLNSDDNYDVTIMTMVLSITITTQTMTIPTIIMLKNNFIQF